MSSRQLWFVRRGKTVSGPFPTQSVTQNTLLGRFLPTDEVSQDKQSWRPLVTVRELLPNELLELQTASDPLQRQWLEERLKAAHRWADQRSVDVVGEDDSSSDRRNHTEFSDETARFHHHLLPVRVSGRRYFIGAGIAILLVLVLVWVVFGESVNPVKVVVQSAKSQCQQAARPGIDWKSCDKQSVRMRGKDLTDGNLSYANFSQADLSGSRLLRANLTGTNLRGADLSHADLAKANLSFSDLRSANLISSNLTGAILENAIWIDGRVCAPGSVGVCR
ncbi:MAG: pentapeptide repeat-containing protein [Sulfuricellaceae bacterium]|nr:pentapeptide repeat-containing protein [Sulfuricellaceae bacterium]